MNKMSYNEYARQLAEFHQRDFYTIPFSERWQLARDCLVGKSIDLEIWADDEGVREREIIDALIKEQKFEEAAHRFASYEIRRSGAEETYDYQLEVVEEIHDLEGTI